MEISTEKTTSKIPDKKKFVPLYVNKLPQGSYSELSLLKRIPMSLSFTFALMFKMKINHVAYVETERHAKLNAFQTYFTLLWLVGSFQLVLIGITLANTSPVLKSIIGKILF